MLIDDLFFPELQRREQYSIKSNGEYYADYSVYREEIREDCLGRCVYCDVHENGGAETMQLDHFRPKAHEEHSHLVNDPKNLVWSCPGCNRLKSNTWPALGTEETCLDEEGFIDAFEENRNDYFLILEDGRLDPMKPPAQYMISLLALNRQSRKRCRELRWLKRRLLNEVNQQIDEFHELREDIAQRVEDQDILDHLEAHERKLTNIGKSLLTLLDFALR